MILWLFFILIITNATVFIVEPEHPKRLLNQEFKHGN